MSSMREEAERDLLDYREDYDMNGGLFLSSIHPTYNYVRLQKFGQYESMAKVSSGLELRTPGDDPVAYGIAQEIRNQVSGAAVARRGVADASMMLQTTNSWMDEVRGLIYHMAELSAGATDASKSEEDRDVLNTEYLQLKKEVARIAATASYNGKKIISKDHIIAYDKDLETFTFCQLDGSDEFSLGVSFASGLTTASDTEYLFDDTHDYIISPDGNALLYVDENNNLTKYDIANGTITRDTDTAQKAIDVDEQGRMWYLAETTSGSGGYALKEFDIASWTQNTDILTGTEIADIASTQYSVYMDKVYYLNTSGNIVSRGLFNTDEIQLELDSADIPFSTVDGQFALSKDGQYIADVPSAGALRVISIATGKTHSYTIDPSATITSLTFSCDNNELFYVDTNTEALYSCQLKPGENPRLGEVAKVQDYTGSLGFGKIRLNGGRHVTDLTVHVSHDNTKNITIDIGDMRLYTLGLSRTTLDDPDKAQEAMACLVDAIEEINEQQQMIHAHTEVLEGAYSFLTDFADHNTLYESELRDVDIAKEMAAKAQYQIAQQAGLKAILNAQSLVTLALQLLQK